MCSSDEFKETLRSQLGFISNPIYIDWVHGRDLLSQLDQFATTLEAKYTALSTLEKWDGLLCKASVFWVNRQDSTPSHSSPRQHKYPSYREWFINQTCDICG